MDERHHGDLGNIKASKKGTALLDYDDHIIQLSGVDSILGRSIICHTDPDDEGMGKKAKHEESKKSGNSGGILASGTIGLSDEIEIPKRLFKCNWLTWAIRLVLVILLIGVVIWAVVDNARILKMFEAFI